ncbi:MAG: sensor histidine kinase [Agriterribacter sp.]
MQNIFRLLNIIVGLISSVSGFAQDLSPREPVIEITAFHNDYKITTGEFAIATLYSSLENIDSIPLLSYQNPSAIVSSTGVISGNINSGHVYLKFTLSNRSDTARSLCFYPGYYFKTIHLFINPISVPDEPFKPIADNLPDLPNGNAYRIIKLDAGETSAFYVQLQPVRIKSNILMPELVDLSYMQTHSAMMHEKKASLEIVTYILVGIMCMMVLFAFANYILTKKNEFLYYCMYAALIALLLFAKTFLYRTANDFTYFFEEYLDFIVMLTGSVCYVAFVRYFLATYAKYPLLDKVLKYFEIIYTGFLILFSIVYFTTSNVNLLDTIESSFKFLLLSGVLLFVILGFREKSKLVNYLAFGNLAMVVFGLTSLLLIIFPVVSTTVFTSALFYYDLGIVTELAFFLFGLTYKGRKELIEKIKIDDAINLEQEKKEFEKQLAIIQAQQEERNRISADMHDELGGGMTAIRLMSELAKHRMQDVDMPEIERISSSANDLLSKMNAIIWSMSPSNDSLANLIAYIRSYTLEFFENTLIRCEIIVKEDIPVIEMSGIKRRNIFLALKEALNNILKHAKADAVLIHIDFVSRLTITIQDNGIGFDQEKIKPFGNGLHNMRKRMELIDGSFNIEHLSKGTKVTLYVSL